MKFKLDENLGLDVARILRAAGHDVSTVRDQNLQGIADLSLYEVCRGEKRCLVTLDLDFANVLRFPPESTAGLVVFRPPDKIIARALPTLARQLLAALERERVNGRLWIVELTGIRVHQASEPYG